jgi:hypothetical protein
MTKDEIIQKTMRDLRIAVVRTEPPYSDEPELETYLANRLPDGEDIKTCDDFKHLGAQCCGVCHYSYPVSDMLLIELPEVGKAWVCDQVEWAIFPQRKREFEEWERTQGKAMMDMAHMSIEDLEKLAESHDKESG